VKSNRAISLMRDMISQLGSASTGKGDAAEGVIAALLTSKALSGPISQCKLVEILLGMEQVRSGASLKLPNWCSQVSYCCRRFVDSAGIFSCPDFLAAPNNVGTLLSASTVMRPDGVCLLSPVTARGFYAMVVSSAVYSGTVPSKKQQSQELSTLLRKAYYLADGSAVNVQSRRKQFEAHGLNMLAGSLRIHFLLPKPTYAQSLPFVTVAECKDRLAHSDPSSTHQDLVLNITQANLIPLFRAAGLGETALTQLLDTLCWATRTGAEDWAK
jgi:hypothetical protein